MNLVRVKYDPRKDMCSEKRVKSGLNSDAALKALKSASYPAYIYEPGLVDTNSYFAMEVKNKACVREYAKQKD